MKLFVFRYLPDLSESWTPKYKVELKTINSGKLKGESYFIADQNYSINEGSDPIIRGLSTVGFLKLNPFNVDELLSFQNKHGQITSTAWKWNSEAAPKLFQYASLTNIRNNLKLIFPDEEHGFDLSASIHKHLKSNNETIIFPVSLKEAQTSIVNLQNLIKSTIKVKAKKGSIFDEAYAEYFFELGNFIIQKHFPSCEMLNDIKQANKKVRLPLMEALIIDQLISLNDAEAYKRCKNCGCIFQYKEGQKRRGAEYCSEFCQEEAKWKRQNERRRTKNKQLRKERDNG